MNSKKFISFILLLFFLSSTGVPQVIHRCNLTGEKSFDVCAACSTEEHEEMVACCKAEPVEQPSCCEEEQPAANANNNDASSVTSSTDVSCCTDQINLLKISDDYSATGFAKTGDAGRVIVATVDFSTVISGNASIVSEFQDIPPPLFGKHLLFSIHQLKIATPLS
ncbi:MAG: hypothetical protein HBSAPP04_02840 [Ignavibacteriaceae bacterium]|nr:MAG: hypothetical protein EDM75_06880 [Chlorobiota bacterium]GJQ31445.1 MAG: hypothetical protein HBSAPP04_02840 [Ignavibacteriaceae bacterium]